MISAKNLFQLLVDNPFIASDVRCDFKNIAITGVSSNSAACQADYLFVATKGAQPGSRDGHDFIDDAIKNGASVIVVENGFARSRDPSVLYIVAHKSREALAFCVEAFYDFPSRSLTLIGITGTNGKTSTSFMLHRILAEAGHIPKIIGTLGMGDPGSLIPLTHTTPEPEQISRSLATMRDQGVSHVIMEVSSHALSLARVEALRFIAVGLTNITRDHLDFHPSFQAYIDAKARLFSDFIREDTSIAMPFDHLFSPAQIKGPVLSFGKDETCDVVIKNIHEIDDKTNFTLCHQQQEIEVHLPFLGDFQAVNAGLAAALALNLGVDLKTIAHGLSHAVVIPGRLEAIASRSSLRVFVDYAHTPDALEHALTSLKKLPHHRLIVVFGCAGDRDPGKRPLMGAVAERWADLAIITDDNPRSEDPAAIRTEVKSGIYDPSKVLEIGDRLHAIKTALTEAKTSDIVLIAGKGHETYQIYGKETREFSDRVEAQKIMDML